MAQREHRRFIRHPTGIPVEIRGAANAVTRERVRDLSVGGLSFHADAALTLGSVINLRIATVEPAFETQARVVWCRHAGAGYDLGVAFLSAEDAFRARMVEQVCHIESYRRRLLAEGRALTPEAAAREWIARFAASFPDPDRH
jgi:c-di-GMP-binding flagellar brake protein YcgR